MRAGWVKEAPDFSAVLTGDLTSTNLEETGKAGPPPPHERPYLWDWELRKEGAILPSVLVQKMSVERTLLWGKVGARHHQPGTPF